MRPSHSFGQLATLLLAATPIVSAWPGWLPEIDALVVRQDSKDKATTQATNTATADSPKKTDDSDGANTANLNTGGITKTDDSTAKETGTAEETGTATGTDKDKSGKKTTSKKAKHKTFNEEDPAASVVMVSPATTDGTQLYKIGDFVTWTWNYTGLQGTPTAVDVLVSCSVASNTWTLTQNMTFETKGVYTWDTNKYQKTALASPLLTEEYVLIIYDAESSVSATADPGYLAPFSGFTFGMYEKRPYKSVGAWKCATCSGAMSDTDKRALGFALSMSVITVLSFTWFVAGFRALL